MSHSLERRCSSCFLKPTTPKRFSNDPSNAGSDTARHRRVEDENSIEKQYLFGDVLGTGAFGVVKEVTNRLTQQHFAMKIVNKDKPGSSSIQLLEREVEVLKRVNHPHIIQLEEVFETAKKMYLIMELCKGGEVCDELRKRGYFKEEEAKTIMRRLTEAVVYMHDNDMVHRDLKLENILLSTADPSDNFNIKVIMRQPEWLARNYQQNSFIDKSLIGVTDFGLAHMKGLQGCDDLMHTKCGTLYYMAPEVLNNKHEYTKMCDVWSMGVIMYTLLCGRVPFKSDNAAKLEELILQGELNFQEIEWINVSQVAKDLIKSMLCVDTSERYTARKVLDDPWFTGTKVRGIDALQLMRDLDSESEQNGSIHSDSTSFTNSLDTVPESVSNDKASVPNSESSESTRRTSVPSTPTKRSVKPLRARTQSVSAVVASSSGTLLSHSMSSVRDRSSTLAHGSGHHQHTSTGSNSSGTQAKHKLSNSSGTRSAVMSTKRPGSSNGSRRTTHKKSDH